ncbi:DNA helicase UvrD [Leptolyngbya sp. 'hensonii']|uniref:ATP-dependent helicase n=1 Tax=Leptolyngbya sp. 'hensonii' TaxID=1922337 RepID=UPI00094FE889|nr:ATP-dependent helicase [Leptolyngbya sp. 'hensonii']OLP20263.1 DNA helicase UvrD [Leptolyngbya sp. 'hensonii']
MISEQDLQTIRNSLRSGQQEMTDWQSGPLAVSAVPGSGKSTGMAAAAAIAIVRHQLHNRRQLMIVTFTRSAAANIRAKVRAYLQNKSPVLNAFTVHTLHGLALNIATRHPNLSGMSLDRLTLVTPNQNHHLIRTCVEQWIAENPQPYQRLLEGLQFDGEETERLRRQSVLRTEVLPDLAQTVIHEAKSSGYLPADLRELQTSADRDAIADDYGVLAIAAGLYDRYQDLLRIRGWIDYDDMILGARRVLQDETARQLWQDQVFAVFEDEAQDSTPLQTELLEILAAGTGGADRPNLVRVGDPNQAINSTFTPADPVYFRQFCDRCSREGRLVVMDRAGRSSPRIMEAANFILEWVNHKIREMGRLQAPTDLPFRLQTIHPVAGDDPQADANPQPAGRGLELCLPEDIDHTAAWIGSRVIELFADHPEGRAAILVRENRQGRFLAEALGYLEAQGIQVYDVSRRERYSKVPAEILALLQFMDRPHSSEYLKGALAVLVNRQLIPTQDLNAIAALPERFLYPGPLDPPQADAVRQARRYCTGLLRARLELPYYQLIPFLSLTLTYDQSELATADKLAERVARQVLREEQPQRYAPAMGSILTILREIVGSERFEPVETEDPESRYVRPGQLTIITMHKAKGLDWDYVFLPFLHAQLIPGSLRVPLQAQFLGNFTLAEVARAQIRAGLHNQFPLPDVGSAWERAQQLKTAEEYRLLYVAMTRAKRLLWMAADRRAPFTWSNLDNLEEKQPCPALTALQERFPDSVIIARPNH